jgi:hypothetical protein
MGFFFHDGCSDQRVGFDFDKKGRVDRVRFHNVE